MVQDTAIDRRYLLTQDEYDDRMIASIELKSQDFNDENFSPVFTRLKKEFVLRPGEKFSKDMAKVTESSLSWTTRSISGPTTRCSTSTMGASTTTPTGEAGPSKSSSRAGGSATSYSERYPC